jgi:hypothetical protein
MFDQLVLPAAIQVLGAADVVHRGKALVCVMSAGLSSTVSVG